VLDALVQVLPPDRRPAEGEPKVRFELTRGGVIRQNGSELARLPHDRAAAIVRFGSIVRHHLALHAPVHVFVHAGVVSIRGTLIVIPGKSRTGKTTLVSELVRAGSTYYSDEYAPVDADGLVHPYPKPLSVRPPGRAEHRAYLPVPESQIGQEPARAGLIVVTSYEAGAAWAPTTLTAGEAAFALLDNTVAARSRPADALAAVSRLARDASVLSGARGEASELARALLVGGPFEDRGRMTFKSVDESAEL
jgi:hypothetical protein